MTTQEVKALAEKLYKQKIARSMMDAVRMAEGMLKVDAMKERKTPITNFPEYSSDNNSEKATQKEISKEIRHIEKTPNSLYSEQFTSNSEKYREREERIGEKQERKEFPKELESIEKSPESEEEKEIEQELEAPNVAEIEEKAAEEEVNEAEVKSVLLGIENEENAPEEIIVDKELDDSKFIKKEEKIDSKEEHYLERKKHDAQKLIDDAETEKEEFE